MSHKYINRSCSFAMDTRLHKAFTKEAKARCLNASALVRKFVDDQLEDWGLSKEDIYADADEQPNENGK